MPTPQATSVLAYIALGSNLGDRHGAIRHAVDALGRLPGTRALRLAAAIETAPIGCPEGSGNFLNTVAEIETSETAEQLLVGLLAVEESLGRTRPSLNAPRTIDLDLLLYGSEVIRTADLVVPHPRMHLRHFVLAPLCELAPNLKHPVLGRSIRELLAALPGG